MAEHRRIVITGEVVVRRPVAEVFGVVADTCNEPSWNRRMRRAEMLTPGPPGVGTRFRAEFASPGRPVATIEITGFDPPHRLATHTRMRAMDVAGELTFDPVPDGTRMRWCWRLEPHGVLRHASPLIARIGARRERGDWEAMRRRLEAWRPAAGARILFVSGSIGLGHATRDLAIASELRRLRPGIAIDWLAGEPARGLIAQAGERVLPGSAAFDETAVAEAGAAGFSLNVTWFTVRAARAWVRSLRAVLRALEAGDYDMLVGDETYEVSVAFDVRPSLRRVPFTMIYDFVGLDAMTRNPLERMVVGAVNRLWAGGRRGAPPSSDPTLFVGELGDVPDRPFGPGLPSRRAYARRHYHFLGDVLGFDPAAYADRARVRSALRYDERPLVVCTAGGTAVGADLLRRCAAAFPHLHARVPDVRMVVVCGPRIAPAAIGAPAGVEVRGLVPRLHEHLAACDVAVVQAGGTTTLELTALRRPFLWFPVQGHAEQNLTVAPRLRRLAAGREMSLQETTPEGLARAIQEEMGREPGWPARPADGATRAAELILARLPAPVAAGHA